MAAGTPPQSPRENAPEAGAGDISDEDDTGDGSDSDTTTSDDELLDPRPPPHRHPHTPTNRSTNLDHLPAGPQPAKLALYIWSLNHPATSTPHEHDPLFHRIVTEIATATRLSSGPYGAEAAAEWGAGFDFDPAITTRHAALIAAASPDRYQALACAGRNNWHTLNTTTPGRLNPTRVTTALSTANPAARDVMELATPGGGVRVPVPPDFIPNCANNGPAPRLPSNTTVVAGALRKMIHTAVVEPGLGFVLTLSDARRLIPNLHVSPCAWAPKDATISGRNCINCSNGGTLPGNTPLNSDDLRTWMRTRWGRLSLPTIEDLVCMVIAFYESQTSSVHPSPRITIWKMDIKGAYTLLTFHPDDLHLVGCLLPGDYVVIPQGGTFGWTGMPFVFDPVTRAITWELNHSTGPYRLLGRCSMYVDDIFGVSLSEHTPADMLKTQTLIETLLGDGAVATKKTEFSETHIDVIGYRIDIARRRVGITERNRHRAFAALWELGDGQSVSVRQLQRVASHASRYKRVVPLIAPYTNTLHRARNGHTNKNVRLALTARQMEAIWMIRALLITALVRDKDFTRSFTSFRNERQPHRWVIEYDASLNGIGILWYQLHSDDGREIAVGGCAINLSQRGWADEGSGLMNFVEFLAGTIGIKALADRGIRNEGVKIRGDNKAAMKWAKDKTFKSDRAGRVAISHVMMTARSGIDVVASEHLPHGKHYDWNWRADWLSRGRTMEDVRTQDKADPPSRLGNEWREWEIEGVETWIDLCDPLRATVADATFIHDMTHLVNQSCCTPTRREDSATRSATGRAAQGP